MQLAWKGQASSLQYYIIVGISDCGPLFSPLNGMVTFEDTTAGSIATYVCDDGYILLGGGETRTCGALRGVWSNVDLTCNGNLVVRILHNSTLLLSACSA